MKQETVLVALALTILLSFVEVDAFSSTTGSTQPFNSNAKIRTCCGFSFSSRSSFTLQAHEMSRGAFFSQSSAMMLLLPTAPAAAEDSKMCPMVQQGPSNCVSTANVKQVNNYAPPWTFSVSPDEAAARIKGVIASDPTLTMLKEDQNRYFLVTATRGVGGMDQIEFWINPEDQVVTFRSFDMNPTLSDFGANRKRIDSIRKTAGVFGIMGEGLTADSFEGRSDINGPMAQLKAFYGLQSGEGFQEVFEDE
jgi:uncharacterized protein (DUF1499 family)